MAERTFSLLKSLEGKTASINGATQIRAGVIRPEVIVPLEVDGGEDLVGDDDLEARHLPSAAGQACSGMIGSRTWESCSPPTWIVKGGAAVWKNCSA